jgi:hypothetical protein
MHGPFDKLTGAVNQVLSDQLKIHGSLTEGRSATSWGHHTICTKSYASGKSLWISRVSQTTVCGRI